jgi:ribosomal protein L7/L12
LTNPGWDREVRELLATGRKIEAIKLYRERTGAGLKQAKDAVEAIERGQEPPAGRGVDGLLENEVVALLEQGEKIRAIRLYRERTGADLKASKEAVEELGRRRGLVVSRGAGCFGVILVLAIVAGAAGTSRHRPLRPDLEGRSSAEVPGDRGGRRLFGDRADDTARVSGGEHSVRHVPGDHAPRPDDRS